MRISDWSSDVCSSDLEDGLWIVDAVGDQGHHYRFAGRSVVNAAGPTVLDLLRRADAEPDHRMRLVRGSHIVRSEERRVGNEWVSTCTSRWSPYPNKKKTSIHTTTTSSI